jgi:hypothetical protein
MTTCVSSKGQIVLPAKIRRQDRNERAFAKTGVRVVNPFV